MNGSVIMLQHGSRLASPLLIFLATAPPPPPNPPPPCAVGTLPSAIKAAAALAAVSAMVDVSGGRLVGTGLVDDGATPPRKVRTFRFTGRDVRQEHGGRRCKRQPVPAAIASQCSLMTRPCLYLQIYPYNS